MTTNAKKSRWTIVDHTSDKLQLQVDATEDLCSMWLSCFFCPCCFLGAGLWNKLCVQHFTFRRYLEQEGHVRMALTVVETAQAASSCCNCCSSPKTTFFELDKQDVGYGKSSVLSSCTNLEFIAGLKPVTVVEYSTDGSNDNLTYNVALHLRALPEEEYAVAQSLPSPVAGQTAP